MCGKAQAATAGSKSSAHAVKAARTQTCKFICWQFRAAAPRVEREAWLQAIVIGADTSQGKTSLALNIAEHCAVELQRPVGIISLEMSGTELTQRLTASSAMVNLHRITTGEGTEDDWDKLRRAANGVGRAPIFIRDESDIDSIKLRAIGRQLRHQHKVDLIVLDYIQLLTLVNVKEDSRERAVSIAAQNLKQRAKELGVVVIGLSQVNEGGKLRESRPLGTTQTQ